MVGHTDKYLESTGLKVFNSAMIQLGCEVIL